MAIRITSCEPIKVIRYREAPLLQINDPEYYAHILKRNDMRMVKNVVRWLNGFQQEVFLGGSAVSNWIHYGRKGYSDIDLLACPSAGADIIVGEKERLRLIQECNKMEKRGKAEIGNFTFDTESLIRGKHAYMYMNTNIHERFGLAPRDSARRSRIDLSIVSRMNIQS